MSVTLGDRFLIEQGATFRIETADGEIVITGQCQSIVIEPDSAVTTEGWPYDATTTITSFEVNLILPHPEGLSIETDLALDALREIATIEPRPKTRAGLIEV